MSDQQEIQENQDHTASLRFTASEELKKRIQTLSEERGCSTEEVVRELLDQALDRGETEGNGGVAREQGKPRTSSTSSSDFTPSARSRFGQLLLAGGTTVREDFQVHIDGDYSENPFVERLLEQDCPDRDELVSFLSRQFEPPEIDLDQFHIHPDVIGIVPEQTVRKHLVLPVAQVGPVLCLAQIPPLDPGTFAELHRKTGLKLYPVSCEREQIRTELETHYQLSSNTLDQLEKVRNLRLRRDPTVRLELNELPDSFQTVIADLFERDEGPDRTEADSSLNPISTSGVVHFK